MLRMTLLMMIMHRQTASPDGDLPKLNPQSFFFNIIFLHDGLKMSFSPYHVASFASGKQHVFLRQNSIVLLAGPMATFWNRTATFSQ